MVPGDTREGDGERRGEGEPEDMTLLMIDGARLEVLKVMPSRFLSISAPGTTGFWMFSG